MKSYVHEEVPARRCSQRCSQPALMAQTEITFGHVGGPTSLFNVSAEHFAEIANERLPDEYEVVVYHSSQLGNDSELLQKLRLGTVHLALPSTIMSSVADEFGLFELPYLVRDREHMKRIEEEIFWPTLHPIVERRTTRFSPCGRTASATSPTTCARS
jgi:TRAP-type transport system periplasmic protein